MHPSKTVVLLLCLAAWLQSTTPAAAQVAARRVYAATASTSPTVSPYLNLGVGSNGLSNYPSLVRPLLNEREQLARQATAVEKLRPRFGMPANANVAGHTPETPARQRRFLNYSHYYGTVR